MNDKVAGIVSRVKRGASIERYSSDPLGTILCRVIGDAIYFLLPNKANIEALGPVTIDCLNLADFFLDGDNEQ